MANFRVEEDAEDQTNEANVEEDEGEKSSMTYADMTLT